MISFFFSFDSMPSVIVLDSNHNFQAERCIQRGVENNLVFKSLFVLFYNSKYGTGEKTKWAKKSPTLRLTYCLRIHGYWFWLATWYGSVSLNWRKGNKRIEYIDNPHWYSIWLCQCVTGHNKSCVSMMMMLVKCAHFFHPSKKMELCQ